MKKIVATIVLALILVGCGSAPATHHEKAKPVAKKTADPVVVCTQQTMKAVEAGLEDEMYNVSHGTTGFHEFNQLGLEMGRDSVPYQFAINILPPLIPVMASSGEVEALRQGTQQAEAMCRSYNESTQ